MMTKLWTWFRHRMQDLGLWWFHLWIRDEDWVVYPDEWMEGDDD